MKKIIRWLYYKMHKLIFVAHIKDRDIMHTDFGTFESKHYKGDIRVEIFEDK